MPSPSLRSTTYGAAASALPRRASAPCSHTIARHHSCHATHNKHATRETKDARAKERQRCGKVQARADAEEGRRRREEEEAGHRAGDVGEELADEIHDGLDRHGGVVADRVPPGCEQLVT